MASLLPAKYHVHSQRALFLKNSDKWGHLRFFITYGKVNNEDKNGLLFQNQEFFMNNSKMLLLAAIATFGSFSIINAIWSDEEKTLLKQFAQKSLTNAINSCKEYNPSASLCDHDNNCGKNYNLFLKTIQEMPMNEIQNILKNRVRLSEHCTDFAEELTDLENKCNTAIVEGKKSSTYFELSLSKEEQEIYNKTLEQSLQERNNFKKENPEFELFPSEEDPEFILGLNMIKQEIEKGNGNLTFAQFYLMKNEETLRKELGLTQKNNE